MIRPNDRRPLRLNVGSGHEVLPGFINLDVRPVPGLQARADALRLPFAAGSAAEVRAGSLLEHFEDPGRPLAELHRVLADDGRLVVRVPALGTNAAHLDPTHRYLADLFQWKRLVGAFFERVRLGSTGVRYRSSPLLVGLQRLLIAGLGFHDLGQCWVLTADHKRRRPEPLDPPWWKEVGHSS